MTETTAASSEMAPMPSSRKPFIIQTVAQSRIVAAVIWMVFCAYLAFADTAAEYPRQMRMQ